MLDLSLTLEQEAARFVRELCRHRAPDEKKKTNTVRKDQHGDVATVRGGMFNANGGRQAFLSVHGLTKADVTAFRKAIGERLGFEPPVPMAEALLIQTHGNPEALTMDNATETRRARERTKKAKRRQWAREHGICIMCCKNPATGKQDGTIGTTCWECQDKANARKKR